MKIKSLILIALLLFTVGTVDAKRKKKANRLADKDTQEWRYEIECMGVGVDGAYVVKVWSYSKNPNVAIEQAKKNAVHGIIFKGFVGNTNNGCTTSHPLVRNPNVEVEKKDFFDAFFADGGKYLKFVALTSDGHIDAADRLRIGKKEYKIGVIVSVQKKLLREDLEAAGIVKPLNFGF